MTAADKGTGNFADDIVTRLIETDIDGEVLDQTEFAFFVILLAVAGGETTRNATTHGMNALFDNADQWELFKRNAPKTAVDESIRWATPAHCFQRTALTDNVIGDVTIRRRQQLGLGVGWCAEEFELLGARFAKRGKRTEEMIELMRALGLPDGPGSTVSSTRRRDWRCPPRRQRRRVAPRRPLRRLGGRRRHLGSATAPPLPCRKWPTSRRFRGPSAVGRRIHPG